MIGAAALWLVLAAGPGRMTTPGREGALEIATQRGGKTYLYLADVADLSPALRRRLVEPALPELLPADPGAAARTVIARFQPLGTPFARWPGRRMQGLAGEKPVCTKAIRQVVLLGAVEGTQDPAPEAMREALAQGVIAGEMDDREGACKRAELFHDPDLGALIVADGTSLQDSSPAGRDEIYGGTGRLRIQPEWLTRQARFQAARPDAGTGPLSWDGAGARGLHYALGTSPFVAAASTSPDCGEHVALLFHAMNKPILIWPFLSFDSPAGSLPRWIADLGELWPVMLLDGALLAPQGDHYSVVQRFPGTPSPRCPEGPSSAARGPTPR